MSTSSANPNDRLGQVAQSFRCAEDEGLLSALSSVPNFPFGDAASHPVNRRSDNPVHPATTSQLEMTRDGDVYVLPNERQIHEPHGNKLPPRDLTPDWVIQPRGHVNLGAPTRRLRRRGYGLKKLLVTSAIAAMVGGSLVVEILILVEDADFPSLPKFASGAPPLRKPAPPSTDFSAIINLSETERMTEALSPRPAVSLRPTARSENQPTESGIELTLPQMAPGSEYEKIAGKTAAIRQPPSIAIAELSPIAAPELSPIARPEPTPIATPELRSITTLDAAPIARLQPTSVSPPMARPERTQGSPPMARLEQTPELPPIARPEPTQESPLIARPERMPESPPINQAPPHIGKVVVADRDGFLFADSNIRYLTRGELQRLSADQLHIARNEIFARRGRYFKDDVIRTYFSQFPWYRPHAWDVPLRPVEQANVGLIQSIEAPAAASRGITGPLPAQTGADNDVAFADPSRRYLTPEELQGLSADQLVIVRNEIFARRGRYFKDDALRAYFSQFPWYQPYAWDVPLSPIEQANVKLLQSFEQTASTPRQAARVGRGPPM